MKQKEKDAEGENLDDAVPCLVAAGKEQRSIYLEGVQETAASW